MLEVPQNLTRVDLAFGNVKHLPKYDTLPDDYRRMNAPGCRAVSMWFYKGAEASPDGIKIDGVAYKAKEGVDAGKALAAIKSCLGSFEPKHEHKIAGCGFMFSEWFERQPDAA